MHDQETSILRGEFVKMFQEVIHHQTRVSMMKVINPIDWPVPLSLQGLQSLGRVVWVALRWPAATESNT